MDVAENGWPVDDSLDGERFRDWVQQFASDQPDPSEGDIWSARWGSTIQLIGVREVNAGVVFVCPLSYDVALGDEASVLLPASGQTLGRDVIAFTSLGRELPTFVLEFRFGQISRDGLDDIRNGIGIGAPITSVLDERGQLLELIEERMLSLSSASWIPESVERWDVSAVLRDRGLGPGALASELGFAPGAAASFLRGERTLSHEQMSRLASWLGLEEFELENSSVPHDLQQELNRPVYRQRLLLKGRSHGVHDEGEWRFRVATSELAVAARTDRSIDPRTRWAALIEDYLRDD